MCNFQRTADLKEEEFKEKFLKEEANRQSVIERARGAKMIDLYRYTDNLKGYWEQVKTSSLRKIKT